jgi:iron-sulfur cluster assembly protein
LLGCRLLLDLVNREVLPSGERFPPTRCVGEIESGSEMIAMLALSERAVTAINGIMSNAQVPEGAALRVSPQLTGNEPTSLELSLVEAPLGGDQVVQEQGVQVCVDERIGPMLDDKVLDATTEGEEVLFTIIDQGEPSASP